MSPEQETEWRAWGTFVVRLRAAGIDIDAETTPPLCVACERQRWERAVTG